MSADLQLLRDLGEARRPPTAEPPARLRQRVLDGLAPPAASGRTRTPDRLGWARWRPPWALGAATVACAALIAAFAGGGSRGVGAPLDVLASESPRGAGPDASRILTRAAQQSVAKPDPVARPDQFVFIESVRIYMEVRDNRLVLTHAPVLRQEWRSVDGSQNGLYRGRPEQSRDKPWQAGVIPRCDEGSGQHTQSCPWSVGSTSGLPTDTEGMLRYLHRPGDDPAEAGLVVKVGLSADQKAFWRAMLVLDQAAGSPSVQAAVFEATAKLPGVTVISDTTDASGRNGVAVAVVDHGGRMELVFDRNTYTYLGTGLVLPEHTTYSPIPSGAPSWYATSQQAILRLAIVDRAGQVP